MEARGLPSGEVVDVCECGVFADYFDGEPRAIARLFVPGHQDRKPKGALACAACGEGMTLLRYRSDQGPELYRCHGCAAVFMTPSMLDALRRMPAPDDDIEVPETTLLERIAEWFRYPTE